jgi:hypothetical protein
VQGIIDKFTMYSKPYEREWSFERPIPVEILFYHRRRAFRPGGARGHRRRRADGPSCGRWRLLLVRGAFPAAYYLFMASVTVVFPRFFLILLPALLLFCRVRARRHCGNSFRAFPRGRAARPGCC